VFQTTNKSECTNLTKQLAKILAAVNKLKEKRMEMGSKSFNFAL